MDASKFFDSLEKFIKNSANFSKLTDNQKAGVKAHLSRLLTAAEVVKPSSDVMEFLQTMQAEIGVKAEKPSKKVTAEDVIKEFNDFPSYNSRERGAYKAKVKRMLNEAVNNNLPHKDALLQLESQIDKFEKDEKELKVKKLMNMRLTKK